MVIDDQTTITGSLAGACRPLKEAKLARATEGPSAN
jgi:hypothetical protein